MRRRRRSNPLGLFFVLVLGGLLVGGSVWLDRRGEKVLAPVQAKHERVTLRHDPQGTWYRWYELGVGVGGSGVPTWVASVEVPETRFDSIRIGDSVQVRYLPQLPLFARASDRSTATVAREAAQRVGIVPLLLWLVCGIAGLWIAARVGTLAVVAGALAWLAAGFPVLLWAPAPPTPAGSEGTARVHAVTLVAKSPSRTSGRRRKTRSEWRRLAVPYQVIHLLVPEGSDTVLAVDAVDSGSVRGLSIGADLPVRYDPKAPRNARLVPGTRSFIQQNRYHYLPIAIGIPALGMLAALGFRWRRRPGEPSAAAPSSPASRVRSAGRAGPLVLFVLLKALAPAPGRAQETVSRIPFVPGLTLLSSLHFPEGDRENVVEVVSVDSSGVRYAWSLVEVRESGDTIVEQFRRHVRANDLAGAPRLDPVFMQNESEERPGYTAFSISSAVYTELRERGSAAYSVTSMESAGGVFDAATKALAGGVVRQRARYKGTLSRASPQPTPFPLLVDGRRVMVPALHLRGSFARGLRRHEYEYWVLADSAHPLLLKSVVEEHVFQLVRVNFPLDLPGRNGDGTEVVLGDGDTPVGQGSGAGAGAGGGGGGGGAGPGGALAGVATLERELDTACRIELPGVYFAFNSARIDPASDRSLGALARVLAGHPDWVMTVEGHTDSIGTVAANQKLSQRRAEAVRARLAERHGMNTSSWNAVGYGPSRPQEPNATIEGRARNRRVELIRDC